MKINKITNTATVRSSVVIPPGKEKSAVHLHESQYTGSRLQQRIRLQQYRQHFFPRKEHQIDIDVKKLVHNEFLLYLDFFRPQTKLREGNVFAPVSHSVYGDGQYIPTCTWPGGVYHNAPAQRMDVCERRGEVYTSHSTPPRRPLKRAVRILLEYILVTSHKRGCGKVMFSQVRVSYSLHRGRVCEWAVHACVGVCMHWGHVWWKRDVCGEREKNASYWNVFFYEWNYWLIWSINTARYRHKTDAVSVSAIWTIPHNFYRVAKRVKVMFSQASVCSTLGGGWHQMHHGIGHKGVRCLVWWGVVRYDPSPDWGHQPSPQTRHLPLPLPAKEGWKPGNTVNERAVASYWNAFLYASHFSVSVSDSVNMSKISSHYAMQLLQDSNEKHW